MFTLVKILLSALLIGLVTEIARRFPAYGGIIAALPLVSLLSIIWLYVQGEEKLHISKFALGVLWGFPATAVLLIIVYISLKHSIHLYISISLGIGGWLIFLMLQSRVIRYIKHVFLIS
ncbi:DUF3147 family protein [Pseudalkalibacillus sp. A8]|uniref:DUF3147 family protein n=1 Tax=Pseudalkalibacillus sp. A8 TaxID=3382641 RepID=UPI0038B50A08